MAGMENYVDKSDDMKLEIEELELLMDPEDSAVDLRYILTHARTRESKIFEIFSTKEKRPLCGKQKPFVGVPRTEGRAAREVAKRSERNELRRNDSKGSSVPRKKDEDAAVAAELFVDKG